MSVGRALGMVLVFGAFGAGYLSAYPIGPSRFTWFIVFVGLLVVGGLLVCFSRHRPSKEPSTPERSPGHYGGDGYSKSASFTAAGAAAADAASGSDGGDGAD